MKLLDFTLAAIVAFHLLLSPYTKVEESFTIQAVHDILNHGILPDSLQQYDHVSFPGVVPRTFVGSLAVAAVIKAIDLPFSAVSGHSLVSDYAQYGQLYVQILARAVVGAANIWGLLALKKSVNHIVFRERPSRRKGLVGACFIFLLMCQFHVLYYATRTLPNFMALPVVNVALSKLVVGDLSGLAWLAFTGVVFRLEVGIFASCIALSAVLFGSASFAHCVVMLAAGALSGLFVTAGIDSYFWQKATIPELQAFWYNVVAGNSVNWGVEPFKTYFSKYVPNFFRPPHVPFLAILGLLADPAHQTFPTTFSKKDIKRAAHPARNSLRILGVASVLFVIVMSLQPHKEWRFVVYVVPVITLLAANGLAHLWWRRSMSYAHRALFFLMISCSFVSLAISTFMGFASSYNYPGGVAISYVNSLIYNQSGEVLVHMDVPACMTGVTKFTESHDSRFTFDKTEQDHELAKVWNDVDYLITHKDMSQPLAHDLITYEPDHWNHLTSVPVFSGVNAIGVIQSVQRVLADEKYRASFIAAVLSELKKGKFSTLEAFLRNALVLRDYLHVYKRTARDSMPTMLDNGQNDPVEKDVFPQEIQDTLEIDPQDVEDSLNNQIDYAEDFAQMAE